MPKGRQGCLPVGGADASADGVLLGLEDAVRRGRGQGFGAGNIPAGMAAHRRL